MRRIWMVALIGGALALGGCTGSDSGGDEPGDSAASPSAKDGHDYDACSDGDCEVVIDKRATIKLDKGFEADSLAVTVKDGLVHVRMHYPDGGKGSVSVQGNAQVAQNDLVFTSPSSSGTWAVLRIQPAG